MDEMIDKSQIKDIAKNAFAYLQSIDGKIAKDELDCAVETYIFEAIQKITTQVRIVSEEYGNMLVGEERQPTIVVDPIDGTGNLIRGIPIYSVAIALLDGDLTKATVHDIQYSVVVSTFGIYEASQDDETKKQDIGELSAKEALVRCIRPFRLRMLGASTVELCLMAAGSIDGFVEIKGLKSVDLIPVLLILEKSGCHFSDKFGNPLEFGLMNPKDNCFSIIAARDKKLLAELVEAIKEE